jgi:competence protein ComGF
MKILTWTAILFISISLILHIFFALLLLGSSHKVSPDTTSTVSVAIVFLVLILAVLIGIKKKQNAQSDED